MLLSYTIANFHSFAGPTTVSMRLTARDVVEGWECATFSGERVTTAMAMIGANGAGKSNLVKVGPFLSWFVTGSFALAPDAPIAFMPHQTMQNMPSEFEVETEDSHGVQLRYVLHTTRQHVIHEGLYRKEPGAGSRPSYVFERELSDGRYVVKQQGFGLAQSEAEKVRPNVSLISWGNQYGAPMAVELASQRLSTNLTMRGRASAPHVEIYDAAEFFGSDDALLRQMTTLLRGWDLGLDGVRIDRVESKDATDSTSKASWYPVGIHQTKAQSFELPFAFESSGTKSALVLLWRLLPILRNGGIAFIDELESDLHPHMIEAVLRLFHDEDTNPHGAQLVFTCQSPEVLRILRRTQVTFVEKTDCVSSAYRGDEIEGLTSAHNLYAKYMAGALGAVPEI